MLVECLIKREGPTYVDIGKMRYIFGPQPVLTGGDHLSSVCPIDSKEHCAHLLYMPSLYREYQKKTPAQMLVLAMGHMQDEEELQKAIDSCCEAVPLKEVLDNEIKALNPREWMMDALTARIKKLTQASKPEQLTKESFVTVTNAPTLKSLIKKCEDKELVRELLEKEKQADNPREWVGQALADRIDELEKAQ